MQPLQLDADMSDSLDRILFAAAAVLKDAHNAYEAGRLTPGQIECVHHLRNDLGQLIARFSDGHGFTGCGYQDAAIGTMRSYEQMADAWLAAVYGSVGALPRDEWKRIKPGRYLVTRTRDTAAGAVMMRSASLPGSPSSAISIWDGML